MQLQSVRRLTGPSLLTTSPAAGGELILTGAHDSERCLTLLREEVARVFGALALDAGGEDVQLCSRLHPGGLSVAVPAPMDALNTAVDALELAVTRACGRLADPSAAEALELGALPRRLAEERNPAAVRLAQEACRRQVPCLWDEDALTLGQGERSVTYAAAAIPEPSVVPWERLGRIPVAMITGTNGKTTTTRLIACMVEAAGRVCGYSSTDGLVVGRETLETGDWSGPGGARHVLRDTRTQAAALETARGGLLRRGLAVTHYDVAVITNVGDDHFGEYGIHNLASMAQVKALVGHGVRADGRVVLNAGDAHLVALTGTFAAPVVLFTPEERNPALREHLARGGEGWYVSGDTIMYAAGEQAPRPLLPLSRVPITFAGAAAHNVENALAAAATGWALGLPWTAVASGLEQLAPSLDASPARGNVLMKDGVRLLLDFAHNPAGVQVTLDFVAKLRAGDPPGSRLFVLSGQAGDRSDDEIRALARSVHAGGATDVIAREQPAHLLRGRKPGEVPALMCEEWLRLGIPASRVFAARNVTEGLARALDEARPGDTVALLTFTEREESMDLLAARGWLS